MTDTGDVDRQVIMWDVPQWDCLMFPPEEMRGTCLWQKYLRSDAGLFSSHAVGWGIISICPPADNFHFEDLVRLVFSRLLKFRCPPFRFVINMLFNYSGDTLRLFKYPSLHQTFNLFLSLFLHSIYLFISFISIYLFISVWTHGFLFYSRTYNSLLSSLIDARIAQYSTNRSSFKLVSGPFLMNLHHSLSPSFPSCRARCSCVTLPAPALESAIFPKIPCFFLVKSGIKTSQSGYHMW